MKLSTLFVLALAAFVGNCLVAGSSFKDITIAEFGTQSNNLAFSIEDLTSATTISDAEFDFAVPEGFAVVGFGDTKSSARAGRDDGEVTMTLASSGADGSFGAGDKKIQLKSGSRFGGAASGTNKVGQGVQESFADGESTWFGELGGGFGEGFTTVAEADTVGEAVAGGGAVSIMNFDTFFNGLSIIPDDDDDETSSNVGESDGDNVCAPGTCTAQADTTSYQVGNFGQCFGGTKITKELLDGPAPPAACKTCECGKCYEVCTKLDLCQIVTVVDNTGTATFEIAGKGPPGPTTGSKAWGNICPKCNSANVCVLDSDADPVAVGPVADVPGAYCSQQPVTQREVPCPSH